MRQQLNNGVALRTFLLWLLGIALALLIAGVAALWFSGAWYAIFPSSEHDEVAPTLPADLPAASILVFTKTNGFRHGAAIDEGTRLFQQLAEQRGWGLVHTENGAVFNSEDLARFKVVIFHCASGDMLNEQQEQAFQSWLTAGGAWLGTHAAGDSSHKAWRWYTEELIGAEYNAHPMNPQFQTAKVITEKRDHPATKALPAEWEHEEEWYSWHSSPRQAGMEVLLRIDESSYSPFAKMMGAEADLRMGEDHPVMWQRCIGQGRALYSALGHQGEAWQTERMAAMMGGALDWLTLENAANCR